MSKSYFVIREQQGEDAGEQAAEYVIREHEDGSGKLRVTTPDGEELVVDAYAPEPSRMNLLLVDRGELFDLSVRPKGSTSLEVEIDSMRHEVEVMNARQRRMMAAGVGGKKAQGPELVSPMAGKVAAVSVAVGEEVDEGQCVLIVEAMKMENDLKAHRAGKVAEILVSPGDTVEIGDVLARIDA